MDKGKNKWWNFPKWADEFESGVDDYLEKAFATEAQGKDIDVYMQPLVKDLKELWESGLQTYDASTNQMFNMHAALHSTISDFPAYAMLSGWSTQGKMACPCCHYETCSTSLPYSGKICYMDHRRFLDKDHTWRFNKRQFHGKVESRSAPVRLTGTEVVQLLCNFKNDYGKKNKKKKKKKTEQDQNPWRKFSSLFDLPYWHSNKYRHNLDVMHIEKNVFDNVINTLLNIPGKTKDHIKAREDLVELGIMPELQPKESDDGKVEIPKALFTMTPDEKQKFCLVMKNAKLPKGYASNIKRCVQAGDMKISGYKSHDAHIMMHYLLPIAVGTTLNKDVASPLIRLCYFFKSLWSKVIDPNDLDHLQREISQTLCEFEKIFPPAFFDVMVHLPIHLVEEIRFGGPVASRCMYAIERYLRKLKAHVKNKARPEGSMAEGFLTHECVTFCSRYLNRATKQHTNEENNVPELRAMFPRIGYPLRGKGRTKKNKVSGFRIDLDTWNQVQRYILFNCESEEIEKYINEHKTSLTTRNKRKWDAFHNHNKDFISWFKEKVDNEIQQGHQVHEHIKFLSVGPSHIARRYSGYAINGYIFHTKKRDANCVTDNSGVTLTALTPSFASSRDKNPVLGDVTYYGSVQEIIEINYNDKFCFVLFRCVWFYTERDDYGLIRVNQSKFVSKEEPFILASQAHQTFYVEDPTKKDWYFAVENQPKDEVDGSNGSGESYCKKPLHSLKA